MRKIGICLSKTIYFISFPSKMQKDIKTKAITSGKSDDGIEITLKRIANVDWQTYFEWDIITVSQETYEQLKSMNAI